MNIPGTHDAATWNYSLATQRYLDHVTDLVDTTEFDPAAYRCQTRSFAQMLDDGIRAFDLRYAYDVTNSSLVFWHGPALQSQTATVDDVMYGFYRWLDQHPSEVVFLSFQYQSSTTPYATNSQGVQSLLFDTLTSPAAKQYIQQTTGEIGTLGESRGRIMLLKRFDLDRLPASYDAALPGLHFSPTDWTENGDNITLTLNASTGLTAYIEDYFLPQTSLHSTVEENIRWKVSYPLNETTTLYFVFFLETLKNVNLSTNTQNNSSTPPQRTSTWPQVTGSAMRNPIPTTTSSGLSPPAPNSPTSPRSHQPCKRSGTRVAQRLARGESTTNWCRSCGRCRASGSGSSCLISTRNRGSFWMCFWGCSRRSTR